MMEAKCERLSCYLVLDAVTPRAWWWTCCLHTSILKPPSVPRASEILTGVSLGASYIHNRITLKSMLRYWGFQRTEAPSVRINCKALVHEGAATFGGDGSSKDWGRELAGGWQNHPHPLPQPKGELSSSAWAQKPSLEFLLRHRPPIFTGAGGQWGVLSTPPPALPGITRRHHPVRSLTFGCLQFQVCIGPLSVCRNLNFQDLFWIFFSYVKQTSLHKS